MTQRVSTIRELNKYDYSADIRPYILTSVNTNNVSNLQTYAAGFGSTTVISGGSGIGLGDITSLTLERLEVEELEVTNLTSFEMSTEFLSSFTVRAGGDVRFFGVDDNGFNKFFWDSSESTQYIDGKLLVKEPLFKLHIDSNNSAISQDKYDNDIGVYFKYYDQVFHGDKYGFFGFDGVSHRFSLKESIFALEDRKIIGDGTNQSLIIANMEANNIYVSGIQQIETSQVDFNIQSRENNDINIISGKDLNFYGENVNFNISSGYQLVNNNSNTSFLNSNGDINLQTVTGDVNLDVEDGNIDIKVDGSNLNQLIVQNTLGDIQILSGSQNDDSILIDTDGGIQIDVSDKLNINLTQSGESLSFNSSNGLVSTIEKTDYNQWISFYKFNTFSGFYLTDRDYTVDLGVTLPKHYWKKEKNNEKSIIFTDVEISNRESSNKGYKLKQVGFGYRVEDADLNSILVRITYKKFDIVNPPVNNYQLNVTNIAYNDINLTTSLTQGTDHYGYVEITNPVYINNGNILNIELEIDTPSNSLFKFYGCNLKFSRNDL